MDSMRSTLSIAILLIAALANGSFAAEESTSASLRAVAGMQFIFFSTVPLS